MMKDVQTIVIGKLKEAFKTMAPKVYVEPFEGILSISIAGNRYANTPLFLVSPLAIDDKSTTLATYFLATSSDRNQLSLLDEAVDVLRNAPGDRRIPLEVSVKNAYDDNALKKGLRIWVLMASWPHLADSGVPVSPFPGPVESAVRTIAELFPEGIDVATTEADRRRFLFGHALPFVTVEATAAEFEKTEARRIFTQKDGKRYEAKFKGFAVWNIEITAYARTEGEAEEIIWPLVPYIPFTRRDEFDFNTSLYVTDLEEGDSLGAVTYKVKCKLSVPAYRKAERIPVIRNARVLGKEEN